MTDAEIQQVLRLLQLDRLPLVPALLQLELEEVVLNSIWRQRAVKIFNPDQYSPKFVLDLLAQRESLWYGKGRQAIRRYLITRATTDVQLGSEAVILLSKYGDWKLAMRWLSLKILGGGQRQFECLDAIGNIQAATISQANTANVNSSLQANVSNLPRAELTRQGTKMVTGPIEKPWQHTVWRRLLCYAQQIDNIAFWDRLVAVLALTNRAEASGILASLYNKSKERRWNENLVDKLGQMKNPEATTQLDRLEKTPMHSERKL